MRCGTEDRDQHPIEVAAQVIASRFIRTTGKEKAVERGLKAINEMRRLALVLEKWLLR